MADLEPGTVFAGHRIQAVAGRGGMGVVYRATQLDLDRPVALKVIAPALAQDGDFRARFVRESRVAASIDHPNVIPIYYAGEHEGVLYIAMRYVDGEDLRARLHREGALDPDRAAQLTGQLAAALDAAHARGIVHRDVKPANVLLGGADHAYLTDFGLTKNVGSHSGLSRQGQWVGTLGYVAPEQIRGAPVDARADVYALGCLLFYALTGAAPYRGESDEAVLWAHLNAPAPSPRDSLGGIPEGFDEVIERALAKDPGDRYLSAGDLGRAALGASGRLPGAPPPERLVARGAAAPPDADRATVVSADDTPTRAPAEADGLPLAARRSPARRGAIAAAAALGLAATVGAVFLLAGRGGAGSDPSAPAEGGRAVPLRLATIPVGTRPNDVVVTAGRVWAVSGIDGVVQAINPRLGRRAERIEVGKGATALAAGFGSLWVVKQATDNLLRYDPSTLRRVADPVPLPPGVPFAVVAGEGAIWVGSRSGLGRNRTMPQSVSRVDPRTTSVVQTVAIPGGVQDLATGFGAVWVANRKANTVTRLDIESGEQQRVGVGGRPSAIAVGAGAVWLTIASQDRVVRVDPATRRTTSISVGAQPKGIAAALPAVWVANEADSTLTRIDPRTRRRAGKDVDVGLNPKALVIDGRTVWVAAVGQDALSRVVF